MRIQVRSIALALVVLSANVTAIESSDALGRRPTRNSSPSKPTRPDRSTKPAQASDPAPAVVTLPGGISQVIPDPTQCVLQTAHRSHPGRLIGGRIDRAGSGRARIRGPVVKGVEKGIAQAREAVAAAMEKALGQMKADMIAQINAGFQIGGLAIGCDAVLANYQSEALRKCNANHGRFTEEGASQCAAGRKTREQRDTCNCLVAPIADSLVQNCSLLSQSPEIQSVVNAAHANCKKNEAALGQIGQALSGTLSQRNETPSTQDQE